MTPSSSVTPLSPLFAEAGFYVTPLYEADRSAEISASTGTESGGSEWDYLWKATASIPITAVPEPTTAVLLLGGAILLAGNRFRNRRN